MLLRALIFVLAIATAATASGQTVYVNDFNAGDIAGWSTPLITDPAFQRPIAIGTNPFGDRLFLGEFGNQQVTFTTSGLPLHDSIVVELDLYVIRSWDGNLSDANGPDIFAISDGASGQVMRTTFTNRGQLRQAYPGPFPGGNNQAFTGAIAVSVLGYAEGDAIYHVRLAYPHASATLALTFTGELRDQFPEITNESWAIDNISIVAVPPRPASATLVAGTATGAPGDQVFVPIIVKNGVSVASSGATSVQTTLRYNASMLMPESPTPIGRIEGRDRVIDLEFPLVLLGDSTIGVLAFRVAIGDDTVTSLTLENSSAVGGDIALSEQAGVFKVKGLCEDGGVRLFREERAVLLRMPAPNPMRAHATLSYALAADDDVRLELIDASGAIVATLVDAYVDAGEHSVELNALAAGRYVLRLVASGVIEERVLVVVP